MFVKIANLCHGILLRTMFKLTCTVLKGECSIFPCFNAFVFCAHYFHVYTGTVLLVSIPVVVGIVASAVVIVILRIIFR